MAELKILNTKEIKEIMHLISAQWGVKLKLDYVFLRNPKNRVFVASQNIGKIQFEKLRINSIGTYFCEIDPLGIRLTIEGSQIVGPKAEKNVAEITEEQAKLWLKGEDLEIEGDYSGFVIIKHNNDFLGNGKYKSGKIFNYVSKSRRINAII
jgi:NOL1/NOP2/fmu family ribosome biogenesis protein